MRLKVSNAFLLPSTVLKLIIFHYLYLHLPQKFLMFTHANIFIEGDGETTPSYYNAQFSRIVDDNLLEIEKVRGVNKLSIAGTDQYEFKGTVLADYKPILETNSLSHNRAGLLTRRQLTAGPEFGITVGSNATSLDGFHIVFGTVLSG